jgi:succinoglycan biosynthesis protein ExoV
MYAYPVSAMKLVHFRGPNGERNFGDELGPWLWERLLDGMFDDNPDELFLGIGTILNDRMPSAARVIIFGSGVGYGKAPPSVDPTWSIYCLRGPLSADALGVSRQLAITDPGALVRLFRSPRRGSAVRREWSYMPHWRSACDDWRRVCEQIGFNYIDPRAAVDDVLDDIQRTGVLITEAMHGAICADALRVPWIPVRSTDKVLEFKWHDWCASLQLTYAPIRIPPVMPLWHDPTLFRRAKHSLRKAGAAVRLWMLALTARPMLSDETLLEGRVAALCAALAQVKADLHAAS